MSRMWTRLNSRRFSSLCGVVLFEQTLLPGEREVGTPGRRGGEGGRPLRWECGTGLAEEGRCLVAGGKKKRCKMVVNVARAGDARKGREEEGARKQDEKKGRRLLQLCHRGKALLRSFPAPCAAKQEGAAEGGMGRQACPTDAQGRPTQPTIAGFPRLLKATHNSKNVVTWWAVTAGMRGTWTWVENGRTQMYPLAPVVPSHNRQK